MTLAALLLSLVLLPQDATIVTVNRQPITQADLDRARGADPSMTLGRLLVELVDEQLLVERGKDRGYAIGDDQFQFILGNIKKQNNITSDEQLDAALKESNLTRAQLRANLERSLIASRVLHAEALAQISDEDAQRYFNAHLQEFPLQTFEAAKPDVIAHMKADRTARDLLATPYLQSLRRGATLVWSQPELQQAYEQASK